MMGARFQISGWLAAAMQSSRMTRTMIAEKVAASRPHISDLLDGRALASTETIVAISKATRFPVCPYGLYSETTGKAA